MKGKTALIALFLFISAAGISFGASPSPVKEFVERHRGEIVKLNGEEAMKSYLLTHLLGSYRDAGDLMEFTDALTSGVYTKEVSYILKEKILETRIDAQTLKSTDRLKIHLARIRQAQPLTVNINEAMRKIGYGVTAATLATQVYRAFLGDDAAKREAMATAFSAELDWIVSKVGSTTLSVSMGAVHFLDYTLRKFSTAQYEQYNEFWWNAYSTYYNQKYKAIVTGSGSWASLAEVSGSQAFETRLNEFWENPLENAALYYKTPSPFQRDALAAAQFRKPFAARYYNDFLKTTLDTYFRRKVEAEKEANLKAAEVEYEKLATFIEDMRVLRKLVAEARKKTKDDNGLPRLSIYKVTYDDRNGRSFTSPAQNGDVIYFGAKVSYPHGEAVPALLIWNFLRNDGSAVTKELTCEVFEAGVTKNYGFKVSFKNTREGSYRVELTYRQKADSKRSVSVSYPFEVMNYITLDKLIVTSNRSDLTCRKSFAPDDDLHFFAYYNVKKGVQGARITLTVKNLSTGAVLKTMADSANPGVNDYTSAEMSIPAGSVKTGEEAVFEAVLNTPDGRKLVKETKFTVEPYRLVLTAPSSLKSGTSGEFSVKIPESFKRPCTVKATPSGGLNVGLTPGKASGTVGAIATNASGETKGKLTVSVKDSENRTAEAVAIIRILPAPALPPIATKPSSRPSPAYNSPISYPSVTSGMDIAGTWSITTVSYKSGQSTHYRMTIYGSGGYYTGTISRLGSHPYSWPAQVTLNQTTGEVSYSITMGTSPPYVRLIYTGTVASGGFTASGTYRRAGGSGSAWSGTWSALKQ